MFPAPITSVSRFSSLTFCIQGTWMLAPAVSAKEVPHSDKCLENNARLYCTSGKKMQNARVKQTL